MTDLVELRRIISELGYCTPDASLEFMALIPGEIRANEQALSERIAVLLAVVDQYRNAPYRSADWLANEVMTILGVVANDAHPLTPDLSQ